MARRKVKESHLGDMAHKAEMDHEVQMARSDLYKIAKYAVELHDMLKNVSEVEGMQGWQQSKITKAADYLGAVYHNMDYDVNVEMAEGKEKKPDGDGDGVPPWADKDDDDPKVQEAKKSKLDPVGKEDDDVNNDGKRNTETDDYLRNRRAAIAAASRNANESMLKRLEKAIEYKEGILGKANASPKVIELAESTEYEHLVRLAKEFKKKVAEGMDPNLNNAYVKVYGIDPNQPPWTNYSQGTKVDLHNAVKGYVNMSVDQLPEQVKQRVQMIISKDTNTGSSQPVAEGQYGEITHHDEDATQSEILVKGMGVYRVDQLEQRIKDRLNNVVQLLDRGEADQAARLLDPNSSTYKSLILMMKALAEAHDDLAFGDQSTSAGIGEARKNMVRGPNGKMVPDYAVDGRGKDDLKKKEVVEDTDIPFNQCPSCGGEIVHVSEAAKKGGGPKDACYHKVKRRYKVWPSAYASGALVQCRKKGAANWGNSGQR